MRHGGVTDWAKVTSRPASLDTNTAIARAVAGERAADLLRLEQIGATSYTLAWAGRDLRSALLAWGQLLVRQL